MEEGQAVKKQKTNNYTPCANCDSLVLKTPLYDCEDCGKLYCIECINNCGCSDMECENWICEDCAVRVIRRFKLYGLKDTATVYHKKLISMYLRCQENDQQPTDLVLSNLK